VIGPPWSRCEIFSAPLPNAPVGVIDVIAEVFAMAAGAEGGSDGLPGVVPRSREVIMSGDDVGEIVVAVMAGAALEAPRSGVSVALCCRTSTPYTEPLADVLTAGRKSGLVDATEVEESEPRAREGD
jgi:hypothetical protein